MDKMLDMMGIFYIYMLCFILLSVGVEERSDSSDFGSFGVFACEEFSFTVFVIVLLKWI